MNFFYRDGEWKVVKQTNQYESTKIREKLLWDLEPYKSLCSRVANLYIRINQVYAMPVNVYMMLYVKSISMEKVSGGESLAMAGGFELMGLQPTQNIWASHQVDLWHDKSCFTERTTFTLALHISKEAYPDLVPERLR